MVGEGIDGRRKNMGEEYWRWQKVGDGGKRDELRDELLTAGTRRGMRWWEEVNDS